MLVMVSGQTCPLSSFCCYCWLSLLCAHGVLLTPISQVYSQAYYVDWFHIYQQREQLAKELISEEEKEKRKAEKRRAKKKVCDLRVLHRSDIYSNHIIAVF